MIVTAQAIDTMIKDSKANSLQIVSIILYNLTKKHVPRSASRMITDQRTSQWFQSKVHHSFSHLHALSKPFTNSVLLTEAPGCMPGIAMTPVHVFWLLTQCLRIGSNESCQSVNKSFKKQSHQSTKQSMGQWIGLRPYSICMRFYLQGHLQHP